MIQPRSSFMKFKSSFKPLVASTLLISLLAAPAWSQAPDSAAAAKPEGKLPLKEVRTFVDILDRIKHAYVEEVDDKTLLENAIKGMLSELDPHSVYLEPEAFQDLQISTTGEFGGLGIEVGMENGFVKVVSPIDDTPADRAGVISGDLIIKLDETPVKGLSLNDAVNLMRGKPGSTIILTIVREGLNKPIEISVVRDIIQVRSVKSEIIEDGYGYVRISQFQVHTGKDLDNAINKIQSEDNPLKGLVLDLRNNPGGVLQAAVEVSDLFLHEGLVVYTKGRLPNSELRFNATQGDVLEGLPIIVLVNGGSASASEIVAGALQDHRRAVIMGTNTFGKGSVQTVLPLQNDRALKLTTARYFTPNGTSIQAQGIVPDIEVQTAKLTRISDRSDQFREADLKGHLENNNGKDETKGNAEDPKEKETLAERDYQLYEALNVLKGWSIISRK